MSIEQDLKLLSFLVFEYSRKRLEVLFLDNELQVLESGNDHWAADSGHLCYKQDFSL